jgi:hypothetical protein
VPKSNRASIQSLLAEARAAGGEFQTRKHAALFLNKLMAGNADPLGSISRADMRDFQNYSLDLFEHGDERIFQKKVAEHDAALRRSTEREYSLIESDLKTREGGATDVSPKRIHALMKKLPPFAHDAIPEEDLRHFREQSAKGWGYLTSHVLNPRSIVQKLIADVNRDRAVTGKQASKFKPGREKKLSNKLAATDEQYTDDGSVPATTEEPSRMEAAGERSRKPSTNAAKRSLRVKASRSPPRRKDGKSPTRLARDSKI